MDENTRASRDQRAAAASAEAHTPAASGKGEPGAPVSFDRDEHVDSRENAAVPARTPPSSEDPALMPDAMDEDDDAYRASADEDEDDDVKWIGAGRASPDDDLEEEEFARSSEEDPSPFSMVTGDTSHPEAEAAAMQRPPADS